jgi:hypothetical protein
MVAYGDFVVVGGGVVVVVQAGDWFPNRTCAIGTPPPPPPPPCLSERRLRLLRPVLEPSERQAQQAAHILVGLDLHQPHPRARRPVRLMIISRNATHASPVMECCNKEDFFLKTREFAAAIAAIAAAATAAAMAAKKCHPSEQHPPARTQLRTHARMHAPCPWAAPAPGAD